MTANNEKIEYTVIRSKRKTLAIKVTGGAEVAVLAPLRASDAEIKKAVGSKENWIRETIAKVENRLEEKAAFSINYGDMLPFCGKEYPLTAKTGNRISYDGKNFYIPPDLPEEGVKQAVIQLYKLAAKPLLTNKVIDYAEKMGVSPAAVKINAAKTRWGSCSSKKSINFSWRLVMASEDVVDYVAVHELAHIKEMNHSQNFWKVVESVFPDYKERKSVLKKFQEKIAKEDWG